MKIRGPLPAGPPCLGMERIGSVWGRFWAGERERLGLPPEEEATTGTLTEEERAELFRQWYEGIESSYRPRGGGCGRRTMRGNVEQCAK